jgi:hypothetical protein
MTKRIRGGRPRQSRVLSLDKSRTPQKSAAAFADR